MRLSGAGEAVRAVMRQMLVRTHHAWHFIHTAPLQPLVRCPASEATGCSQVATLPFAKSKRAFTVGALTSLSDQRPPLHHTRHRATAATPQHKTRTGPVRPQSKPRGRAPRCNRSLPRWYVGLALSLQIEAARPTVPSGQRFGGSAGSDAGRSFAPVPSNTRKSSLPQDVQR